MLSLSKILFKEEEAWDKSIDNTIGAIVSQKEDEVEEEQIG